VTPKWKQFRQSTNIEDRRVPRDITKPVLSQSTDPRRDPATIDPVKVKMDRFRAEISRQPLEQFIPERKYKRR